MAVINDNRQLREWPEVRVTRATYVEHTFPDAEPHAQKLELSCGHWLVNTFGMTHGMFDEGDSIRCRTCWKERQ